MIRRLNFPALTLCVIGILCMLAGGFAIAAPADGPATGGKVILNGDSQLRAFMVFRTPVVMTADGKLRTAFKPLVKEPTPMEQFQSDLPSAGWIQPDFDDSAWDRQSAPVELPPDGATGHSHAARHSATVSSIICMRAKVGVTDPSKATDLKLSLEYVGGVVVYVNGQEVARGHIPAGEVKPDTLAEKYPDDLYRLPDGSFLQVLANGKMNDEAGFERRYRKLDVDIPAKLLRKGSNVLALEIHRAPVNEGAVTAKRVAVGGMYRVPGIWAYAGLQDLRLTSASGQGVVANVARPKGVQIWNVAPFETISAYSYGDPGETLNPVSVSAARNGVFSGRLAVSSDQAISGLKVSVSNLQHANGAGALPSSVVHIRYAAPATDENSWAPTYRFDALVDEVPAEVPVVKTAPPRGAPKSLTPGAVASLWFTVRVPADASPGLYEGMVFVSANSLEATKVPLRVTVNAWKLPDPKDFRQKNLICQSPESVARHYGVQPWSDKHLELEARSLKLLAEVNSREIPMNMAIDFSGSQGNQESMVRWIRKADGTFDYDFGPFDKLLDLAADTVGKPFTLRLNCWGEFGRDGENGAAGQVSLLDPASGKLEPMDQPTFGTEESYKFWKPVIDQALKKIEARGWRDVTTFGHNTYCYPVKTPIVDVAYKLWPKGQWAYTAHNGQVGMRFGTSEKGVSMPVLTSLCVWTEGRLSPRGSAVLLQPRPSVWCTLARTRHWDRSPLVIVRNLPEEAILRGQDGLGDFGGDFFPVENPNRKGRYFNLGTGRGTGGGNNASTRSLLAAGPDGPVASERYEMFREGVQLSEAIIYLEKSLKEGKISGELADKVNSYLDDRGTTFIRDWYDRGGAYINRWTIANEFQSDARLLELAAEVAASAK